MPLTLSHVTKSFGDRTVIRDLSAICPDAGLWAVTGPSGCGKTTLLRMIAGLERPDSGEITGQGQVAIAFQEYRLFPQLTALQNAYAMVEGKERQRARIRAQELLLQLGFRQDQLALYPLQLSGGMKQRVSLARALCDEASLILLDEPLKELDPQLRKTVMELIVTKSRSALIIMTAHDPEPLLRYTKNMIRIG